MTNYEREAYADLQRWQAAMIRKPGLFNRMAKGIQKGINNLIPEKVHQTITDVIKQMIRGVLFGSEKTSLKHREVISLEETEQAVKRSINIYKHTAAAEGGVTGAGGFLASLADFPLLISIKIKMLYDIAAKYGFDTADYKERIYLLHIFELAFCSESKRAIIFNKMKNWDLTRDKLPADIHQYDWRSLQQEYRDYIDLAKMAQMVPVIGAAVGLIANYKLLEKLGETAIQSYRMRIFEKIKPYRLPDANYICADMAATIFFTVTNDLNFDQRMIRICSTLSHAGYMVTLVGREMHTSPPLTAQPYRQKRIACFFEKGVLFYAEYNARLFFYLWQQKMDGICAIDLDTILPCYFTSLMKGSRRVYDAHELFCEMKEIVRRPLIYRFWKTLEKMLLPRFKNGYTVNALIAAEYKKMYGLEFSVIRNLPYRDKQLPTVSKPFLIYQGAVNEGRCFEYLIPAMKQISLPLHVYGDGNFLTQAKQLVIDHGVQDIVFFKGKVSPSALKAITREAYLGINLIENNGLSYYLSLSNRFFDYIQAGLPQVCVDYPSYRQINDEFEVALLIKSCDPFSIAAAVNDLISDKDKWKVLQSNAIRASALLNWENEEQILVDFYQNIFGKKN